MFWSKIVKGSVGVVTLASSSYLLVRSRSGDDRCHVLVIGGGITGSWSGWYLSQLSRHGLVRLTLVDTGHTVRGSWGDTRALHATMEDDVRIKVICARML